MKKYLAIGYIEENGQVFSNVFDSDSEKNLIRREEAELALREHDPNLSADHILIIGLTEDGYPVIDDDYFTEEESEEELVFFDEVK